MRDTEGTIKNGCKSEEEMKLINDKEMKLPRWHTAPVTNL
jgi:hypothetical protein